MMRARARVERRARQESERVDPACRRLGEISSRRRRDCGLACGGAGAMRGADASAVAERGRRVDGISPGPRSKASGRPPPRWWPRSRTSSPPPHKRPSRTKTRRRVRLLSRSRRASDDGERVGADRESARAEDVDAIEMARSRVRAPKMRRPRAPLECPSAGRPRREGRQRAKLFDDEPRRHLLTASEGTAQVATTRASAGLTV
jgi:hypothetical protein